MGESTSESTIELPCDGLLGALQARLTETFGTPFDLWRKATSWTRCGSTESADVQSRCDDDVSSEILDLLEATLNRPETPIVRSQPDGSLLVALPMRSAEGVQTVATTTLSPAPPQLVQRLAESCLRELRLRQEMAERLGDLDTYHEQISVNLEELTYMQGLIGHLELSDVSNSVADVARIVLPTLQELIHAEVMVFVSAKRNGAHDNVERTRVGLPQIWLGPQIFDAKTCARLVARFRDQAAEHPVARNDLAGDPQWAEYPGLESFLLTPATKGRFCLGWLLALNSTKKSRCGGNAAEYTAWESSDNEFGSVEAGLVRAAAITLATHARNLEFFREKETLLVGVVRALINTVDAKDSYTCGHSDRVALIAKRLGEELGLEGRRCEKLYLIGLLHDIGKIGVPDEILRKPDKLTPEEFAHIKQHPQRGCAILQHLGQMSYVLPGVLHHHEHFNGKGYPFGLVGEDIPLNARIVAVADAYDAMSSCRAYRDALPEEKISRIFREGAGTQWDGQVVDALFRAISDVRRITATTTGHTLNVLAPNTGFIPACQAFDDSVAAAVSATHFS